MRHEFVAITVSSYTPGKQRRIDKRLQKLPNWTPSWRMSAADLEDLLVYLKGLE